MCIISSTITSIFPVAYNHRRQCRMQAFHEGTDATTMFGYHKRAVTESFQESVKGLHDGDLFTKVSNNSSLRGINGTIYSSLKVIEPSASNPDVLDDSSIT